MTTKMTETAALAAIGAATRELRLPVVRTDAARVAEVAKRSQLSYLAYLAEVLSAETDERAERRRLRRIAEAHFPRIKRLAEFDLGAATTINPATLSMLASCSFLSTGDPVVVLGDSGTGKSHLLIGLGMAACEQGRRVRYVTAAQLVNELVEAADERRLSRIVARYGRLGAPVPRRARLRQARHTRLGASVPDFDRARGEGVGRRGQQSAVLGVGRSHRRSAPRRRDRRPAHVQRSHHRDRDRVLPISHDKDEGPIEAQVRQPPKAKPLLDFPHPSTTRRRSSPYRAIQAVRSGWGRSSHEHGGAKSG